MGFRCSLANYENLVGPPKFAATPFYNCATYRAHRENASLAVESPLRTFGNDNNSREHDNYRLQICVEYNAASFLTGTDYQLT